MATHSSVLAWRIPGTEEPGGLPSMESHRVGHDWASMIFVKKEQGLCYTWMDKVSIVCNFLITLLVVPFCTMTGVLIDIVDVAEELGGQILYLNSAIITLGIAASVCLRRKGYRKSGLFVQFIGVILFAILITAA